MQPSSELSLFFVSSSGSPGGAERQLANLLNHLPQSSISLLVLNDNKFLESLVHNDNVAITYAHSNSLLLSFVHFFLRLKSKPNKQITIVGWMAKANIFVLFASILLLPFKSISLVWNHRSSFFLYQSFSSQFLLFGSLFLSSLFLGKITHVSNSHSVFAPRLIRWFLFGPKFVIPNGFVFNDLLKADQLSQASPPFASGNKLLLLCPARFSPEKGHHLLFKSLEKVPFDFHITLIGTDCNSQNPRLDKLVSKVRDRVSLIEYTSSMSEQYRKHHYTILLSSSESFPNVIVESMASGVPCICSDVGASKSIVGRFGFVLNDRTISQACKSLIAAYNTCCSTDYSGMCINARHRVLRYYSAAKMARSYNSLF